MFIAIAMGICNSMLSSSLYVHFVPSAAKGESYLTPNDWAYFSVVPPIVFFATLCAADCAMGGLRLLRSLFGRLGTGMRQGLIAALVLLPLTYLFSLLVELFYSRIHFTHPAEHELLKVMRSPAQPTVHWALIAAAVVAAPIFEEFLFRGHIQTVLRRGLTMFLDLLFPQPREGRPLEIAGPVLAEDRPVTPSRSANDLPTVFVVWASILLTSLLFACAHDAWQRPTIFFLSLGLGYAYERTGNLWANIVAHSLFNSVSTFIFLVFQ